MDYEEKQLIEKLVSEVTNIGYQLKRIADEHGTREYKSGPPCIVAGQMVATPNGEVPVEQLYLGMNVHGYDFSQGKTVTTRVQSQRVAVSDNHLLINDKLAVTNVHRVYSKDRGWIPASDLQLGEPLQTVDGFQKVEVMKPITQKSSVYAIQVESHSCFFASGYLVHNKG